MHACVSRWSWWVSVLSVCFDWRKACLLSWFNRKHDVRVSWRYRFESCWGEWAFFCLGNGHSFCLTPSALSFVFLWHTHIYTHSFKSGISLVKPTFTLIPPWPKKKKWDNHASQNTGAWMLGKSLACARWRVAVSIFLTRVVLYCNFTNFRCSFIFGIFGGHWFYRN